MLIPLGATVRKDIHQTSVNFKTLLCWTAPYRTRVTIKVFCPVLPITSCTLEEDRCHQNKEAAALHARRWQLHRLHTFEGRPTNDPVHPPDHVAITKTALMLTSTQPQRNPRRGRRRRKVPLPTKTRRGMQTSRRCSKSWKLSAVPHCTTSHALVCGFILLLWRFLYLRVYYACNHERPEDKAECTSTRGLWRCSSRGECGLRARRRGGGLCHHFY
jgi:hypothetical protein